MEKSTGSRRLRGLDTPASLAVGRRVAALKASGVPIVDLSLGEPRFQTSPAIVERAARAFASGLTGYTSSWGQPALISAFADRLRRVHGLDYEEGEVQVTPGSKFGLHAIFQALLDPGGEVLLFEPTWGSYPALVQLAGGRTRRLRLHEESGWRPPLDSIAAALGPRTSAVLVNVPNNPAGYVWRKDELAALAERCRQAGAVLIVDELYGDLLYEGERGFLGGLGDARLRERVLVVGGVSKSLAMAGWRVGYVAGDRALLAAVHTVTEQAMTCTAAALQEAAAFGLRECGDLVEESRHLYRENAELLAATLASALGSQGSPGRLPAGGIYLFPRLPRVPGASPAEHLLRHGLATVPGEAFGLAFADRVRISFAAPREQVAAGAERLAAALAAGAAGSAPGRGRPTGE